MKAIVLAAGYATRLYPLTKDRPKPLLEINGKTIIEFLFDNFKAIQALDTVYVVTNQKFAPVFMQWAGALNAAAGYEFNIDIVNDGTLSNDNRLGAIADIQYVIEQKEICDDMLVAAGDNIFQFNFDDFYEFFKSKKRSIVVAQHLKDRARLTQRGVIQFDANRKVVGFQEKPPNPASNYVCPALYLHPAKDVPLYDHYLKENNNPDAPGYFIKWLYKTVDVFAFEMDAPAIDIGTLETYERVCRQFGADMK